MILFYSKDLKMLNLSLTLQIANIKTLIFLLKQRKMGKCPSLMSTCSMRMVSFWPKFTEKKHLLCLVSDMSKFHFEFEKPKEILWPNRYSTKFIDKCISKFMNKSYIKKPIMLTALIAFISCYWIHCIQI